MLPGFRRRSARSGDRRCRAGACQGRNGPTGRGDISRARRARRIRRRSGLELVPARL